MGEVHNPNARGIAFLARVETYFSSDEDILCCSARRGPHFSIGQIIGRLEGA